ncbi:hypothetical protein GMJLKIPL_6579 [Methylobacterium isbiliense]|uniref:Uncharacterized protein n=1 Tax=Methylobacterium isbiliense TaxID=315478 RepID=A0ABQ4SQ34_9HYPH|nr:hypothetical protein GMJLKIPL_6579 [Methylobacterium isbiliense]
MAVGTATRPVRASTPTMVGALLLLLVSKP